MIKLCALICGLLAILCASACKEECDGCERHERCDISFRSERLSNPDRYDALLDMDGDGELGTIDFGAYIVECEE